MRVTVRRIISRSWRLDVAPLCIVGRLVTSVKQGGTETAR
jgi:hypothetical protein